jgi:hypothetical protein
MSRVGPPVDLEHSGVGEDTYSDKCVRQLLKEFYKSVTPNCVFTVQIKMRAVCSERRARASQHPESIQIEIRNTKHLKAKSRSHFRAYTSLDI